MPVVVQCFHDWRLELIQGLQGEDLVNIKQGSIHLESNKSKPLNKTCSIMLEQLQTLMI